MNGHYDFEARRMQLLHNVEAWKLQGEEEKSHEAERQLCQLREHLARLEALNAQKVAAEKLAQAARASRGGVFAA